MVRLYALLFLIDLVMLVVALIDCISTDQDRVRNLPKIAWVFIILLFSPIGWICWFIAGRPQRTPDVAWRPGSGFPEAGRRSVAPDDNPEFLRNLEQQKRADKDMFDKWEADLRRREEELKRKDEPGDEKPA